MSDLVITEPQIRAIEQTDDQVALTLYLQPELDYFRGHFPGAPILAGVVQLDWAVQYARQYLGMSGEIADIEVLKFQVVMTPELEVTLQLAKKNNEKVLFSYHSEKGQHASGRLVFAS
ncbi:ApeI family dehydratase [Pseudoalteromonas sp. T1lg10]|uniref:ApeI family dehydratase n=1 Tax=Pseudoalteromonas sp. T1lg10 TaxID=2077093 RepID=UPI000CF6E862|nr:thioester dehydrase [Pseudoalteromonas sp. T1lg10]